MDIIAVSWLIGVISLWLGFAFLVGQLATTRNRSRAGWVIRAILVSPIVALVFLYAVPKREPEIAKGSASGNFLILKGEELVKCPFCAELIKAEAKVCRHCSREVGDAIESLREKDVASAAEAESAKHAEVLANLAAEEEARVARRAKRKSIV